MLSIQYSINHFAKTTGNKGGVLVYVLGRHFFFQLQLFAPLDPILLWSLIRRPFDINGIKKDNTSAGTFYQRQPYIIFNILYLPVE